MIVLTIDKATNKATTTFDGKEFELSITKPNKAGLKPGTHWVNLQKMGCPKKWQTVNYDAHADDVFTVEVDETAARVVTSRKSRIISLSNIKDFLTEDRGALVDELIEEATAERDRQVEEAIKNAPVKEKKGRKLTPEQKLAKKLAEIEALKKQIAAESTGSADGEIEDLDA